MISHAPTGVLTEFGPRTAPTVRPHPLGRDGELGRHVRMGRRRLRSGERAADEVLACESAAATEPA